MQSLRSHLPRLQRKFYQGLASAHWTFSLKARATGWLDHLFHAQYREYLLHACMRYDCICPLYCLMPDHMHVMLSGTNDQSDLYLAARFLRKYLNALLPKKNLQKQAYDHVLREDEKHKEAFAKICHYILENPVRAKICDTASDYRYSGAMIPGYPDLQIHDPSY